MRQHRSNKPIEAVRERFFHCIRSSHVRFTGSQLSLH